MGKLSRQLVKLFTHVGKLLLIHVAKQAPLLLPVQSEPADLDQRKFGVGPDFGQIERVVFVSGSLKMN